MWYDSSRFLSLIGEGASIDPPLDVRKFIQKLRQPAYGLCQATLIAANCYEGRKRPVKTQTHAIDGHTTR